MSEHNYETPKKKRIPLWKWIVIILLVVAMPAYFAFFRGLGLQKAINETNSPTQVNNNGQT